MKRKSKDKKGKKEDFTYETCVEPWAMAQKLNCAGLRNLCIDCLVDHYVAKTAAGAMGIPHPREVKLAWTLTTGDCTLRSLFVDMWALPEAASLIATWREQLPTGFEGIVASIIDAEPVCKESKSSWHGSGDKGDEVDLAMR